MIFDQGPGQVLDSHGGSIISTKVNGCVKLDINTDHEVAGWDPISIPCMLNKAVQEAQKAIINTARTMSDEGSIVLAGRGGDDFV